MDATLERIDNLMHEQKKQYKELNEYLGVGKTTYAAWKNGMSKSYFKHIDEIALFLGVSPNYLIDGHQEKTSSENVCYGEYELVKKYRMLSRNQQDVILNVIRNFQVI